MTRLLPIEILFPADSEKRTRSLKVAADLNMSAQWQVRGSYRTENIIRYLHKWLDPWSDARAAAAADRGRVQASKRALVLIVSAPDRGPCGDREGSGIQPASPMPAQPKKV